MEIINQKIKFFINALLSGGRVGAITMSSDYVVESALKHVRGPLETIVEYGPGDGVMTRALLKLLAPQGKLVVIESSSEFVKDLKAMGDPRMQVLEGSVQDVMNSEELNLKEVDLIISSIPFSFLSLSEQNRVISKTSTLLASGGSFIIFHQYSTLSKKVLEKYFDNISVSFELRNIFPCFILFAKSPKKPV